MISAWANFYNKSPHVYVCSCSCSVAKSCLILQPCGPVTLHAYFEINGVPTEDTRIPRAQLTNKKNKIVASYGADGLVQAKFEIVGFQVKLPTGTSPSIKGDCFDDKALNAIKKLKQGDMIHIQYIKAKGPDGKEIQLRALPIELI